MSSSIRACASWSGSAPRRSTAARTASTCIPRTRAIGETEQRIYSLPAWRETPFFTERERAALAFTESVTLLARDHVPTEAYDAVAAHLGPDEVAALISLITAINAWNTIAVSTRAWEPGSYNP